MLLRPDSWLGGITSTQNPLGLRVRFWNTIVSFDTALGLFSGANWLLVSGRVLFISRCWPLLFISQGFIIMQKEAPLFKMKPGLTSMIFGDKEVLCFF